VRSSTRLVRLLLLSVSASLVAAGATAALRGAPSCGTFPGRRSLERATHRFLSERLVREPGGSRALSGPRIEVQADLVLLSDDGSLVSEPDPFDLHGRTLVFTPLGGGYGVRVEDGGPEPGIGARVGIEDDGTRSYDLSFEFPFFGGRYARVFVNSDGNLSFREADTASTARNLERFLTGPPRVALFFDDLDSTETGEVRVLNVPDRLVVSWDGVPEWGETHPNSFQVELDPDGTVRMRYGGVLSAASGIVGLSPGGDSASLSLADLSTAPEGIEGAFAERFQRGRVIDDVAVARAVYRELGDSYDALVLWTNFTSDLDGAFAYNAPVKNDVRGIGDEVFDDAQFWGSAGKLEGFLNMGDLSRYPRDPGDRVTGAASAPTVLGLLAHEVGHRWLARALVRHDGLAANALLGRQQSHWSFFVDTDASFLEGNDIVQDSQNGFRTVETVARYSRLDLYLMGLAPSSEVAPFFVVSGASASAFGEVLDAESAPAVGVPITGSRVDVAIEDVIQASGAREPAAGAAPTSFRHAWILLTRRDETPTSDQIAQILDARNAFLAFFQEQTLGRAQVRVDLRP
jgi:hypothetical protein